VVRSAYEKVPVCILVPVFKLIVFVIIVKQFKNDAEDGNHEALANSLSPHQLRNRNRARSQQLVVALDSCIQERIKLDHNLHQAVSTVHREIHQVFRFVCRIQGAFAFCFGGFKHRFSAGVFKGIANSPPAIPEPCYVVDDGIEESVGVAN